jgi:adenylyltransferase/sulfurtransferase
MPDDSRYSRQILLPDIGPRGQETLGKSCVLIAGAGGLGSASALYLAAAGVGRIIVVDDDCVELSNLNRQIIHSEASLGQPKALSAANRLAGLNSKIQARPIPERITHENIDSLLTEGVDIMVDASDNYETRQVLNRASLRHGMAWVYGGVHGFDGMASVFLPGRTPCFECIFPHPPAAPPGKGVVGPAAGITASVQAMETIKLLLGIGESLANRLLRVSGLDMRVHILDLSPNPDCQICRPASTKH